MAGLDLEKPRRVIAFRTCADRSRSAVWAGVPAVCGPCGPDEASDHDDSVGQSDEGVDHAQASFGADQQLLEAAVVPGVEPFDYPSTAGLQWESLLADHAMAAEFGQEVPGLGRVVAGIEMDRDLIG